MKPDIHPEYFECTVSCVCGNSFQTRAAMKEIKIEICNACHPFFTGKQKIIDTAGRVERFMRRYGIEEQEPEEIEEEEPEAIEEEEPEAIEEEEPQAIEE